MPPLFAQQPLRQRNAGLFGWRNALLLLLGLTIAFRALALPLSMESHRPQISNKEAQTAPKNGEHNPTCHEEKGSLDPVAPNNAPEKTLSCQIACDIASAPVLLALPMTLAPEGFAVLNAAPSGLKPGILSPPDHPPPIA